MEHRSFRPGELGYVTLICGCIQPGSSPNTTLWGFHGDSISSPSPLSGEGGGRGTGWKCQDSNSGSACRVTSALLSRSRQEPPRTPPQDSASGSAQVCGGWVATPGTEAHGEQQGPMELGTLCSCSHLASGASADVQGGRPPVNLPQSDPQTLSVTPQPSPTPTRASSDTV